MVDRDGQPILRGRLDSSGGPVGFLVALAVFGGGMIVIVAAIWSLQWGLSMALPGWLQGPALAVGAVIVIGGGLYGFFRVNDWRKRR